MSTNTGAANGSTSEPTAPKQRIGLVFAGLLVAMLLGSLDQMVFSTALPTIVGELHGVEHMLWVTTAYLVASTIMMPIYGKVGDLVGHKWIYLGALAIFLVGSVIGGLAPSMVWLIVGRAVQGIGGGGLMILSQAIIADVVPVRERSKYMGLMGGVFGVASVVGPLLGGWFTSGIGWRWAFWMNLPLGLLAMILAAVFLKAPGRRSELKLDVWGIVTMAAAVTSVILVTSWGGTTFAWTSWVIIGLVAVAVCSTVALVWVERRAAEPILPPHLFTSRNFVLATLAGMALGVAMFGTVSYLPTYLQMVTGVSATESGLMMVAMIGGLIIMATLTGQLAARTGRYKWMPILGMVVMAIALALMSTLTTSSSVTLIVFYLFLVGVGIGLGQQILVLIVQNAFPDSEVGTATAANNFFREIGASLGGAAVGAIFTSRLTALLAERLPSGSTVDVNSLTPASLKTFTDAVRTVVVGAYNDALTPIFLMLVPLIVVGLVLAISLKEVPLRTSHDTSNAADSAELTEATEANPT
ncbi:MAG: MDR family MFS transporter [Propionibacteriaceae bacterium]